MTISADYIQIANYLKKRLLKFFATFWDLKMATVVTFHDGIKQLDQTMVWGNKRVIIYGYEVNC